MTVSMIEQIPTLDDDGLAALRANAHRLAETGEGRRQAQAIDLLPAIDAEIAKRKAEKPVRAAAVRKAAAPKKRVAKKA